MRLAKSSRLSSVLLLMMLFMVASATAQPEIQMDVRYGEADGQELLLDVYLPQGWSKESKRPALLVIHGGGWKGGDKKEFKAWARNMTRMGYVAFCINYRLLEMETGRNRWPAQLDDAQRAVRWVRANAAEYGVDPEKIGALGASAGGHLMCCLATMDTRDNSDPLLAGYSSRIAFGLGMYPPTDLTGGVEASAQQPKHTESLIKALIGAPADGDLAPYKAASPLYSVSAISAPMLLTHGRSDKVVHLDHSERMVAALTAAGVEAQLLVYDGGHSIQGPALDQFKKEAAVFLAKHAPLPLQP